MNISLSGRRLTAVLACALFMATVVVWLALSQQARAQGSKGSCHSSSIAHSKRSANVCVHFGRKAHGRSKAKGHHAKHRVGKKKAKKKNHANPPTAPNLSIDPVTLPAPRPTPPPPSEKTPTTLGPAPPLPLPCLPACLPNAWTSPVEGNAAKSTASPFSTLLEQEESRLQFVKTPVSPYGALCLRAEVQQHDLGPVEKDRVQLDATAYTYRPGQNFWLAYAIQLDSSFPSVNEVQWTLLAEMIGKPSAGKGTNSFALEIYNDKWRMTVRGGSRKAEERDKRIHYALLTNAPATKGVWHEFLFHLVLAKDESGKVDGYHRQFGEAWPSTPSVSDTGVNVITVEGVDIWPYPALQVYRATRPEVGIAYFGGFRLRATRVEAEGLFKKAG